MGDRLTDTTGRKLHLDTDLGGDLDDICALAMILNWPGVELLAVTTNSDDKGRRAGYTRHALRLAGRDDVPVAAGADISLGCYRFEPGLPNEADYWPEPIPPVPTPLDAALDLLEHNISQGAIIAAIGPYTNLALLEKRSPGILRDADLWLMGGYVFPTRDGFPAWGNNMDWNIQADASSAQYVLERSNPTLVPLSITVETALRRAYLPALETGRNHWLGSSPIRRRPSPASMITRRNMASRARGYPPTSSTGSTIRWPAPSRWAGMKAWRSVSFP